VLAGAGLLGLLGWAGVAGSAPPPLPVGEAVVHFFPDGAPAGVTGGFGEDSCLACHWEGEENDGVGRLRLSGVPEGWKPGEVYTLEVELTRPGMKVAGFQLAARFASDTTQAGRLRIPESEEARIALLAEGGVEFAQHAEAGIGVDGEGPARWRVRWVAPDSGGAVHFHLSTVAGDGDRSQMGDYVYTASAESPPASASRGAAPIR
jgi:hypothetical protein